MSDPLPKKSLGQHWLNDSASLEAICDAAEVKTGDNILEIGPGKGSLTSVLMNRDANIFAVEFDSEAVSYLSQIFARQWDVNLHVEQGDIRTFNLNRMSKGYKIVANIPYYLTSHLIQIISESNNPPDLAVLLVQKEVAQRVCAGPGDMSLLSVASQFYWETELGREVPAGLFVPPPKVDSQILKMVRRENILFDVDTKRFFRLVKFGFAAKRKTLVNSLSAGFRIDKRQALDLLEAAKINPKMRPQELSMHDWFKLYKVALSSSLLD